MVLESILEETWKAIRVVEYLKQTGSPQYLEAILEDDHSIDSGMEGEGQYANAEQDPLYDQAVQAVVQAQRVSISSIQRRFKIGYNRAACIVEAMEAAGIVSAPSDGNGIRDVLVPAQES